MNNPDPRTYNTALVGQKARSVFFKSMERIEKMYDGKDDWSTEKLTALAACAEAAAGGFDPTAEDESAYGPE